MGLIDLPISPRSQAVYAKLPYSENVYLIWVMYRPEFDMFAIDISKGMTIFLKTGVVNNPKWEALEYLKAKQLEPVIDFIEFSLRDCTILDGLK
jgi:hypothetical protein